MDGGHYLSFFGRACNAKQCNAKQVLFSAFTYQASYPHPSVPGETYKRGYLQRFGT